MYTGTVHLSHFSELTDKLGLQFLRNRKVIPVPLYMTASELTDKLGLQFLRNRKVIPVCLYHCT